ncbi:hypothetical protein BpHYR1_011657 [Brachionus plicatilis]|uniref:Uncharacterized protein n=1 Tax=Brachionus plicatilis TaxID=10195 RepID=A0A3M7S6S5_BRAPC|nr:hypothetical protein BpHYR1_011657 [Brachionus plicatilis]
MQNRILRIIKYFPLKTSKDSDFFFNDLDFFLGLLNNSEDKYQNNPQRAKNRLDRYDRGNKLFSKFITTRQSHELQDYIDVFVESSRSSELKTLLCKVSNEFFQWTAVFLETKKFCKAKCISNGNSIGQEYIAYFNDVESQIHKHELDLSKLDNTERRFNLELKLGTANK